MVVHLNLAFLIVCRPFTRLYACRSKPSFLVCRSLLQAIHWLYAWTVNDSIIIELHAVCDTRTPSLAMDCRHTDRAAVHQLTVSLSLMPVHSDI